MSVKVEKSVPWLMLILMQILGLALYISLNYFTNRENYWQVWIYFGSLFALFFVSMRWADVPRVFWFLLGAAVCFRLSLFLSTPNLSDDVYRFLWDGRLLANHLNPFDQLPMYYGVHIEFYHMLGFQQDLLPGLTFDLYNQIYAGGIYFASYPPLSHFAFYLCTALFPANTAASMFAFKSLLFMFDMANFYLLYRLLQHFKLPRKALLFYALNPLVITEITGNLHFESMMIFFILGALYALLKSHLRLSSLLFAMAVCVKPFPLIFLPLLWRRLGAIKVLTYGAYIVLWVIFLHLPLIWNMDVAYHYVVGLTRFFQKFEFNASVYYVFRWIGFQIKGYNTIRILGRLLSLIIFCSVWWIAIKEKKPSWKKLPSKMLYAITIYFFLALVVHPWYITTLVALSVLTNLRYPLIWTSLLPLTYFTYRSSAYQENLWLIALEYGLLYLWIFLEATGRLQKIPLIARSFYPESLKEEPEPALSST